MGKRIILSTFVATIALTMFVVPVSAESNNSKQKAIPTPEINKTMLAAKIDAPEAGSSATPVPEDSLESTADAEIATQSAKPTPVSENTQETSSLMENVTETITTYFISFKTWATTPMATEFVSEKLEATPAATITDTVNPSPSL